MSTEETTSSTGLARPVVQAFFDKRTSSVQYVVHDPATKQGVVIDPVLDFEERAGTTATENADAILDYVRAQQIALEWILDTHPHADHFSAAGYLKQRTGAPIAIGEKVIAVQEFWKRLYNLDELSADGSQWDRLFADGESFRIGELEARVILCPGHTPASVTYVIEDAAFVHDTLFMPDGGTARADFPGGSANELWDSIQKILSLPDETRLFTGHDYQPDGREPRWESTVAEQKRENKHVAGKSVEDYVALREARDRTLTMPKLILQSLQVNIRGGYLPDAESNEIRYLKIPLDRFRDMSWGEA